jgi:hypothetical protein
VASEWFGVVCPVNKWANRLGLINASNRLVILPFPNLISRIDLKVVTMNAWGIPDRPETHRNGFKWILFIFIDNFAEKPVLLNTFIPLYCEELKIDERTRYI